MFNILILLAVSVAAGYAMRNFGQLRTTLVKTTSLTILLLLLVFGMSIGSNDAIISNLHHDGMKAAVIAIFGVTGSITATLLYRYFQNRKKGGAR